MSLAQKNNVQMDLASLKLENFVHEDMSSSST
jgi:hypothetical protein